MITQNYEKNICSSVVQEKILFADYTEFCNVRHEFLRRTTGYYYADILPAHATGFLII